MSSAGRARNEVFRYGKDGGHSPTPQFTLDAPVLDMAIDGVGLMGAGGHTVDETADLATLDSQVIRAAVTIYRLVD